MKPHLLLALIVFPSTLLHAQTAEPAIDESRKAEIDRQVELMETAIRNQQRESGTNSSGKGIYEGDSPFVTPWLRDYFRGSARSFDPEFAAMLEVRLGPSGPPIDRGKEKTVGYRGPRLRRGEFENKTVDEATRVLLLEYANKLESRKKSAEATVRTLEDRADPSASPVPQASPATKPETSTDDTAAKAAEIAKEAAGVASEASKKAASYLGGLWEKGKAAVEEATKPAADPSPTP